MNKALLNKIHIALGIVLLLGYILFGLYTVLNSGDSDDAVLGINISDDLAYQNQKINFPNYSIHTNNLVFQETSNKTLQVVFGQAVVSNKNEYLEINAFDEKIIVAPFSQIYIDTEYKRIISLEGTSVVDNCVAESFQECRWLVNQWKNNSVSIESLKNIKNFQQIAYLLWEDGRLGELLEQYSPVVR